MKFTFNGSLIDQFGSLIPRLEKAVKSERSAWGFRQVSTSLHKSRAVCRKTARKWRIWGRQQNVVTTYLKNRNFFCLPLTVNSPLRKRLDINVLEKTRQKKFRFLRIWSVGQQTAQKILKNLNFFCLSFKNSTDRSNSPLRKWLNINVFLRQTEWSHLLIPDCVGLNLTAIKNWKQYRFEWFIHVWSNHHTQISSQSP
jgi:hypothetical protein